MRQHQFSVEFYLFLLGALITLNMSVYQALMSPNILKVTVLPAGKGIATLVQSHDKKTLLIDTGSDASILRGLGTALPEWERSIDAIILTSQRASFAGGLPALESRYDIKSRLDIGSADAPYGAGLTFAGDTHISIISAGIFSISHGDSALLISSSTPPKTYVLE